MTQVAMVGMGMRYPVMPNIVVDMSAATVSTLDASTKKAAFIGYCQIAGRASSKTISSSGGVIYWRTGGSVTWASSSNIRVGIQDVDPAPGSLPGRPDGTFDVFGDVTSGSASSNFTTSMSSGTKTISDGDLIAIVFDMTSRSGTDSVGIAAAGTLDALMPFSAGFNGTSWSLSSCAPLATIQFDDGTYGGIYGGYPQMNIAAADIYSDSTNPDERGNSFQVPWDCKVDGMWAVLGIQTSATCDFTLHLVSDPFGTPSYIATAVMTGDQTEGGSSIKYFSAHFPQVSLSKNTNYAVVVQATSTSAMQMRPYVLGNSAFSALLSGGTSLAQVTRNNGSGAFSSTSGSFYQAGVNISSLDDGTGAGGGSSVQYRPTQGGMV